MFPPSFPLPLPAGAWQGKKGIGLHEPPYWPDPSRQRPNKRYLRTCLTQRTRPQDLGATFGRQRGSSECRPVSSKRYMPFERRYPVHPVGRFIGRRGLWRFPRGDEGKLSMYGIQCKPTIPWAEADRGWVPISPCISTRLPALLSQYAAHHAPVLSSGTSTASSMPCIFRNPCPHWLCLNPVLDVFCVCRPGTSRRAS